MDQVVLGQQFKWMYPLGNSTSCVQLVHIVVVLLQLHLVSQAIVLVFQVQDFVLKLKADIVATVHGTVRSVTIGIAIALSRQDNFLLLTIVTAACMDAVVGIFALITELKVLTLNIL